MISNAILPALLVVFSLSAHSTENEFAAFKRGHHNLSFESQPLTPTPKAFITPRFPVIPFNQWQANDGYCGEVSLIQAGMNQGQWMSEYNARLICGTGLSQSGADGFCEAHDKSPNYNSQLLIENPNPGDSTYANADICLSNARLAHHLFDYSKQTAGMAGYEQYLSWIKSETIAGHQVTIGVLNHGGSDPQYDHEVSVSKIGTNHATNDSHYYADDVLYFDDHGHGGIPYTNGYTFASLAKSRADANQPAAHIYSILIPGQPGVISGTGGDGINPNPHAITASNYGFSVYGAADPTQVTRPIQLTITQSSVGSIPNKKDRVDGFNFEVPEIANGDENGCTNAPPSQWMNITLQATVTQLKVGTTYNLYEYEFDRITGTGTAAALAVPESKFNAQASLAKKETQFLASKNTFTQVVETTSDKIIVFRCVEATAP